MFAFPGGARKTVAELSRNNPGERIVRAIACRIFSTTAKT
jgi:hypothetical protein